MTRIERGIVGAAWAAYLASWFLPVARGGELIGDIDTGWKAFLLTLSVLTGPDRKDWLSSLYAAGILGNLMILLSPVILRKPHAPLGYIVLVVLSLANGAWSWLCPPGTLLIGHWLWVGSILAISVIVLRRNRIARHAARWQSAAPKPAPSS